MTDDPGALSTSPQRNVLAERYATSEMLRIWAPETKVRLERELWLAVLDFQRQHGALDVPPGAAEAYEAVIDEVDLDAIRARERRSGHDVKARIDEFNQRAGYELVHVGMTSRDLTENVEQLQVRRSLALVRARALAVLARLAERVASVAGLVVVGRTHNVPAQLTTLGKRLAMVGEELRLGLERVDDLAARYPLRGLKGPVGTQQDMVGLVGADGVEQLEAQLAERFGFGRILNATGQVYPRSLDFDVVTALAQLASGPGNLALAVRLMAGDELVTEGFREGQVGSSAMPHKMNSRSCERIGGFVNILRGHVTMASGLIADQWYEGDVSCSVVRRVVLPDAFMAIDGLLETTLAVLRELGVFPAVVEEQVERTLPFLATTRLLLAAVERGVGRERAHELIRGHAVAAALAARERAEHSSLVERLGDDPAYPLSASEIADLLAERRDLIGRADEQARRFVAEIEDLVASYPEAAGYRGAEVL